MADDGLTRDAFLGGRLSILQPRVGYRAGADAVFLAAAVPARAGARVLELGCGVGVASLCLATRVPGVEVSGVERDPPTAQIAARNAAANDLRMTVVTADLMQLPADLRAQSFDHVMMNPPFFGAGTRAADAARAAARHEETALAAWIDTGLRRLAPKGHITIIHQTARLPAILTLLGDRAGGVAAFPLAARSDRAAERVIVTARKGAKAPFVLNPPLVLHQGPRHESDADSYSPLASAILRDAAGLG